MAPPRYSPVILLLGTIFFFSTNVLAIAAVLGVDLGTEYIKATLVKPGIPLEIVLTKDSRRKETSAVAFKPVKGAPKDGQFPERNYGADAMAIAARFPGEVYPNLKTLLGLPIGDAVVQEYAARHPALQLQAHATRDTATFKSSTLPAEEEAWLVEELLAMELQSIQNNAEITAGDDTSVRSIVLAVPPFYTLEEKRAIEMAAELAGLKVLSLISDGLAVGLNYATSRQFPNINDGAKPEYHVVFDMGAGSTSATVMRFQSRSVKDVGKFNKTVQEIQVLGSGWDTTLGGDSLNYLILDDMVSQFVESKGAQKISATAEGVKSHGRAMAKLGKEAERLRHVLSANQNTQANFEGLYEDVNFKYKITRAEFETMAEGHAERISVAINDALKMSSLDISDLTSIIVHGGATRTPFVQKALEQLVSSPDKIRSNVNSDEAAVFGAAFRAADLSPSFRVKEIRISEGSMYPAGLMWTKSNEKVQRQRLWTAVSALGAAPKEMTFTELDDFSGTFYQQVGAEDRKVASFSTKNLTATVAALKEKYPSCAETGIHFKAGIKLRAENGEVEVVKAGVECEIEVSEKDGFVDGVKNLFGFGKKDQQPLKDGETDAEAQDSEGSEGVTSEDAKSSTESSSTSSTQTEDAAQSTEAAEAAKSDIKKKQLVSIPVEVVVERAGIPQLSKAELIKAKDRLKAFAASDKARMQREEALNQLEAYTYKVRDLVEGETFITMSTEEERQALVEKASEISEWLYDEGDEATKDEFKSKLKLLQDLVAPIKKRVGEAEKRPELISELEASLNSTKNFLDSMRSQIYEYLKQDAKDAEAAARGDFDGLEDEDSASEGAKKPERVPRLYEPEDVPKLEAVYESTMEWFNEMVAQQEALPATADPVLLASDMVAKRAKLQKAGLDIAMRGMKEYEKKDKKASKSAADKKKQTKTKTKTKSADEPAQTINFPEEGAPLSEEELEEMIQNIMKEKAQSEGEQETAEAEHDEL